jgi:ribosomal protein L1
VDGAIVEAANLRRVPRWFGLVLMKAGKHPLPVTTKSNVVKQLYEEIIPKFNKQVKLNPKKTSNVNVPVGNVLLTPKQLVFLLFSHFFIKRLQILRKSCLQSLWLLTQERGRKKHVYCIDYKVGAI